MMNKGSDEPPSYGQVHVMCHMSEGERGGRERDEQGAQKKIESRGRGASAAPALTEDEFHILLH